MGPTTDTSAATFRTHKLAVYETQSFFLLVGGDVQDRRFQVLRIKKTDTSRLDIDEDEEIYGKKAVNDLLDAVDLANKSSGGLQHITSAWGLLGFIRFTGPYHILLITKRSQVALIGGHFVYQVDASRLISISHSRKALDADETRCLAIMGNLDLSRSFYFSYAYDITQCLQANICQARQGQSPQTSGNMYLWNQHLLKSAAQSMRHPDSWCLSLVHGFVNQAALYVYGRSVHITVIARRSRFFAGARFLKRGANDQGHVANDVETEQIVAEMLTTSLHAPGAVPFANAGYTSYVQHRGSIPLYWTQDSSGVSPKPDIDLYLMDPFYTAAAKHFDHLFGRYGTPIFVLNLVKARERTPRESILLKEFGKAIEYLNQQLPQAHKIFYKAWDMSRASKSRDQDVIRTLENIGDEAVRMTGFFHNGRTMTLQQGVVRTNCIDCLDRTNAAQFVIGKRALGLQLQALGIIEKDVVPFDTDAINLFTQMFHDHGDEIAVQYGGSHLVNTMETYRKINQWTSQSRDMVESFKRYYNNSFLDKQRQEAYNLFLGHYRCEDAQVKLWDLHSDFFLHHAHPRDWVLNARRSYTQWFSKEHLSPHEVPAENSAGRDEFWSEYYRPHVLSTFAKMFTPKMNSTLHYIPVRPSREGKPDLSPFRVREGLNHVDKDSVLSTPEQSTLIKLHLATPPDQLDSFQRNLPGLIQSTQPEVREAEPHKVTMSSKDKIMAAQWTLRQIVANSLDPTVSSAEMDEYARYILHPSQLPLVVDTNETSDLRAGFSQYLNMPQTPSPATDLVDYLQVSEDPLSVVDSDLPKKRYKAYRQWMKGKSLFKQAAEA